MRILLGLGFLVLFLGLKNGPISGTNFQDSGAKERTHVLILNFGLPLSGLLGSANS